MLQLNKPHCKNSEHSLVIIPFHFQIYKDEIKGTANKTIYLEQLKELKNN